MMKNKMNRILGMKYICLMVLYCIVMVDFGYAQRVIANDSIIFKVVRKSPEFHDGPNNTIVFVPDTFLILIINPKKTKDFIRETSRSDLAAMLLNEKTDWATNLMLYNFYRKDARHYYLRKIRNRIDWVKSQKEEDIRYWMNYFRDTN